MGDYVNEAITRVNEANKTAYSGFTLQPELILSGIEKMIEIQTVHAGYRTDLEAHIIDNILEVRNSQNDHFSTMLDIKELLQDLTKQQRHTNELLEKLIVSMNESSGATQPTTSTDSDLLISYNCPNCKATLRLNKTNKQFRCPQCNTLFKLE